VVEVSKEEDGTVFDSTATPPNEKSLDIDLISDFINEAVPAAEKVNPPLLSELNNGLEPIISFSTTPEDSFLFPAREVSQAAHTFAAASFCTMQESHFHESTSTEKVSPQPVAVSVFVFSLFSPLPSLASSSFSLSSLSE